jgi:hypothetical protein
VHHERRPCGTQRKDRARQHREVLDEPVVRRDQHDPSGEGKGRDHEARQTRGASPDESKPGRRRGDEQTQDHPHALREVLDRDDDREHNGGRGEHDRRDGRQRAAAHDILSS